MFHCTRLRQWTFAVTNPRLYVAKRSIEFHQDYGSVHIHWIVANSDLDGFTPGNWSGTVIDESGIGKMVIFRYSNE